MKFLLTILILYSGFSIALGSAQCTNPSKWNLPLAANLNAPYYSFNPINAAQNAKRIVFYIHGTNRNGDEYFCAMQDSWQAYAQTHGLNLSETYVLAPTFFIGTDTALNISNNEVYWYGDLLSKILSVHLDCPGVFASTSPIPLSSLLLTLSHVVLPGIKILIGKKVMTQR